ncbi:MFS transporter [Ectobacillus antri]|uniref:MFS transporter n=1 Tax=Ectobacillus antri TaxID=2486280 RepID=UPI000F5A1EDE|nr:MFS transporter [Ectobacillus antri]
MIKFSDFSKLWVGETISMLGSQISTLAIPLTAVVFLNASPKEMGIMQAMATLPFFLFSLFIGVLVDNRKRRPILIMSNIASLVLLASVPLLYWLDTLTISILVIVQFFIASMAVIFELTYLSYLPTLIDKDKITECNSKLEGSRAVAQIAGPSAGGLLVQIFSAPFAIIIDSLSYLFSVIFLMQIDKKEEAPQKPNKVKVFRQIGEGIITLVRNPILRSLSVSTALLNFFGSAFSSLYVIYVIKNLSINSSSLGIIVGIGSIGALVGATIATKLNKIIGIGNTIILASLISGLGVILVPAITTTNFLILVSILVLSQICIGLGGTVYFISQVSLRQAVTPNHLMGRVNASNRFISRGLMPVGALLGGIIGEVVGVKYTLILISIGAFSPAIWTLFTPVKKLKDISELNSENQVS